MTRNSSKDKQDPAELSYEQELDKWLKEIAEEQDAIAKALIEESGLEDLDKELQKELEESDKVYKELAKEQEQIDKGIDKCLEKEIKLEDAAIKELLN